MTGQEKRRQWRTAEKETEDRAAGGEWDDDAAQSVSYDLNKGGVCRRVG